MPISDEQFCYSVLHLQRLPWLIHTRGVSTPHFQGWANALKSENPVLHWQKIWVWFSLPTYQYLQCADSAASREVTCLRTLGTLSAELGRVKPARCLARGVLLAQKPPSSHHTQHQVFGFISVRPTLGFSVLQISVKYNKTGSQDFQITAQSCWQVRFVRLVHLIKGYSTRLDNCSSSRDPLALSWLRAFQIRVIQVCLTETPQSFTNCNFIEANLLLLWAGSAMCSRGHPAVVTELWTAAVTHQKRDFAGKDQGWRKIILCPCMRLCGSFYIHILG